MSMSNDTAFQCGFEDLSTDMADTNLFVNCENCTRLENKPGATIAFPISMASAGIFGNAIALFVLHRNSRREQMKTVFYVLVWSLAWTDLMGIIMTTIPVLIVYSNGGWVGGVYLCNYHAFTMICIGLITPFTVCTMAVERYLGITHGYFYKKHINRSRAYQVLLTLWIFVLLFAALPLFGFGQYSLQYPCTWCFVSLHPDKPIHIAYTAMFAILTLSLIVITVLCNIRVIWTLIRMRFRRQHLTSPSRERQIHRSPGQREIEIQMMILLVGITILFSTSWAPLMIQILYNLLIGHGDDHMQDIRAVRLACVNQTFDPWVYILFRKVIFTKFWSFLRRLFTGKRESIDDDRQKTVQLLQQNGHQHSIKCPCHVVNGGGGQQQRSGSRHHRHHRCHCNCQCTCKPPRNNRHLMRSLLPSPTATPTFRSPEKSNQGTNNNLQLPTEFAIDANRLPIDDNDMDIQIPNCPVIIQCESMVDSRMDDSAFEAELDDDGHPNDNDSDDEEEVFSDTDKRSVDVVREPCPNCQLLKYGKTFPTVNLDECGVNVVKPKRSWTRYLEAPGPKLFRKNQKLSVPTFSESSRESGVIPPLTGSAQSAMI